MTMQSLTLEIELHLISPFLFRGLGTKMHGVDAVASRDERRRPIIPADQIRGLLRSAFHDLAAAGAGIGIGDIETIFGPELDRNEQDQNVASNVPARARLDVTDFVTEGCGFEGELTRIEIDDELGAVKTGMLQVYELVAPIGARIAFRGTAFLDGTPDEIKSWCIALRQAFRLIKRAGSFKSAGFGRVDGCEFSSESTSDHGASAGATNVPPAGELIYELTFDRPFLVNAEWIAPNAIKGQTVVPGGALKGALARKLGLAGHDVAAGTALGKALAALHIRHAFPVINSKLADMPLPLSLYKDDQSQRFEDLMARSASVGRPQESLPMTGGKITLSPAFKSKDRRLARTSLDWPFSKIPHVARTHTAIGPDEVSEEKFLYSTLACSVEYRSGENWQKRVWHTRIDFSQVTDPKHRALIGKALEAGLDCIGKTRTRATLKRVSGDILFDQARISALVNANDFYALLLTTPAYLFDTASWNKKDWEDGPEQHYHRYFKDNYGLELVDFLAQQEWAGRYLGHRYKIGGAYYPWLLTVPGSVFLLRGDMDKIEERIRRGMKPARVKGLDPTWENCPFMPENGYGQVICNYPNSAPFADSKQEGSA